MIITMRRIINHRYCHKFHQTNFLTHCLVKLVTVNKYTRTNNFRRTHLMTAEARRYEELQGNFKYFSPNLTRKISPRTTIQAAHRAHIGRRHRASGRPTKQRWQTDAQHRNAYTKIQKKRRQKLTIQCRRTKIKFNRHDRNG